MRIHVTSVVAFLHAVTAAVFAGAFAGALAGGVGGRLAMRVTALMATSSEQGSLTEADEVVGRVTLDGSLALVVFGGVLVGMAGGLMYAGAARWFGDAGRWRGSAFGAFLLLSCGWAIIEGDNFDFATLGAATVNVLMFGAIIVGFGVLVAPAHAWLLARVPRLSLSRGLVVAVPVHALGLLLVAGTLGIVAGAFGEGGAEQPFYVLVPVYVMAVMPSAGWVIGRGRRFESLADLRGDRGALWAAIAVAGVPVAVGLVLGAMSLAAILGDAYG